MWIGQMNLFVYTSFENKMASECDTHRIILKLRIHFVCPTVKL
jgi:hypothetical protein